VCWRRNLVAGGLVSLLREHLTVQIHSPAVPPQALAVVGSQDFLMLNLWHYQTGLGRQCVMFRRYNCRQMGRIFET
jgi:hypothetical protein